MRAERTEASGPEGPVDPLEDDGMEREATEELAARRPRDEGSFAPDDLRSQRFILSLLGYDRGEVQAYLAHLADHLEEGILGSGAGVEASIDAIGDEVTRILRTTTEAAVELREKLLAEANELRSAAEHEARAVTERAEARASQTVKDAQERAEALIREAEKEAEQMRSTEESLRAKLARMEEVLSGVVGHLNDEEDDR